MSMVGCREKRVALNQRGKNSNGIHSFDVVIGGGKERDLIKN